MDNLSQQGRIAGLRRCSVVLSLGFSVLLGDYSLCHSRIWTRGKFRLRPAVRLVNSPTAPWDNDIFLLCTRASNKHPKLHEVLHLCLTNLIHQLHLNHTTKIHFLIYDPERSINLLPAWYATLSDHFTDLNLEIVLHDRV